MDDDLTRRAKAALAAQGPEYRAPVETMWRGGVNEQQKMSDAADREMIQRIKQNDKPIEEAITLGDVAENVLPWGGAKHKIASAALGTLFDATYGYNTKDYEDKPDTPTSQTAARAVTDFAFGAKKSPVALARTVYPLVLNKVTGTFPKKSGNI